MDNKKHTYQMTEEEHALFKEKGVLPFVPLEKLEVYTAQTSEYYINNIKVNLKKEYPLLEHLPEFMQVKGNDEPIALVGGGPSLGEHLDELRGIKTIIACGSCHDYLIENNIIPTYATMIDPDPVCVKYWSKPNKNVKYLVASSCAPEVFKHLEDYNIIVWHPHSEDFHKTIIDIQHKRGYLGVAGGCTVGLRSIGVALLLGYNNMHFFGFDSCVKEGKFHAYELQDPEYEKLGFKEARHIKFAKGTKHEKDYLCLGYQIAQVVSFREYVQLYNEFFTPTFHGGGLMSDMYDLMTGKLT